MQNVLGAVLSVGCLSVSAVLLWLKSISGRFGEVVKLFGAVS